MAEPAPFFADVAGGPPPAHSLWLRAEDGTRLRAGFWSEGEAGTVLLFPGRTEYVEKYADAARELAARGYAMVAIDWRGQGLADRPLADRNTGHVARFLDYQKDLQAVLAAMQELALPAPYYLLSHSMGGAIALRALHQGLAVEAAVFSAPMWGIKIAPLTRPFARALSASSRMFGFDHRYAPGTGPVTYVAEAPFEDNVLTTDAGMWEMMRGQVTAHPELSLGGPSLAWLHEALAECRALVSGPAPAMPTVTFLGGHERIVDVASVEKRMANWPGGRLERVAGAEHEIMMEGADTRARFFDAAAAHFAAHR